MAEYWSLVRPFENYFADEAGDFAFELLSAMKSGIRESGDKRTKKILEDSTLDLETYRATIARVLEDGYLRTGLSIHWCEGHPDLPISLVSVGESNRTMLTCRVCKQELVYCRFLLPASSAMVWVRQYDGILQYLLPWMLEQSGLQWAANVYLRAVPEDTEKDLMFRAKNKTALTIVECKSDYTDSPDRTVNQKLRDHLIQMAKAVRPYQKLGIEVDRGILATNNEASDDRAELIKKWVSEDPDLEALRTLEIKLIGPNNLAGWWK